MAPLPPPPLPCAPAVPRAARGRARRARPPFLARNLAAPARPAPWDVRWCPRGPRDARRAVLRVRAEEGVAGGRRAGGVLAAVICLRFVDHAGRRTGFWADAEDMVVGGAEGADGGGGREGAAAVEFAFDWSAITVFLRRFPERIAVALELYACAASQLRAPGHALRPRYVAELAVFDSAVDVDGCAVQRDEVVALVAGVGAGDEVRGGREVAGFQRVAGADPGAVRSALRAGLLPRVGAVAALDAVTLADGGGEEAGRGGGAGAPEAGGGAGGRAVGCEEAAGSVRLQVRGGPEWLVEGGAGGGEAADVHVMLTYYSPALPWWNGIVRRDFCCPWCNHDFLRLRTLLVHLQSEHQNARLMFDALLDDRDGDRSAREGRLPVVVNVSVFHQSRRGGGGGTAGAMGGGVAVAPVARGAAGKAGGVERPKELRAGGSVGAAAGLGATGARGEALRPPTRPAAAGAVGEGEAAGKADPDGAAPGREEARSCEYCGRGFRTDAGDRFPFCGEWCEVVCRSGELSGAGAAGGTGRQVSASRPLSKLSSRPRPRRIDYDATLGRRTLYHVVTTTRFKKSHFDENDPDSEDEVDHSWRLQLSEDAMLELPVPPKHKVLWTMWNRFVFENGSPGAYGDQYSQHALELFVLEVAPEAKRLGLRLQVVAFLRAMHVHGCIDGEAALAIMDCLDGRRKRRDCRGSRRPKPPSNLAATLVRADVEE